MTLRALFLVVVTLALGAPVTQAQDYPTPPGFKGKIAREGKNSVPDFPPEPKAPKNAPNILIWMIDDMGFGHSSAYGGPVHMPTLERLAGQGLRYTNFHVTALCSPTRASLLTGRNHHAVHVGAHSASASGFPGYDARVPRSAATLARVLQLNGYTTFALGKWDHLPTEHTSVAGPYDYWPSGQGFDRFYGFLAAETSNFSPPLYEDHKPIEPAIGKPDYHLSADMADKAIKFIAATKAAHPDRPFFMYWATGAVHAPHHAPVAYIDKYKGRFDQGWDVLRAETLARQKAQGLMPADIVLPERPPELPAWDSLSPDAKRMHARAMEVFAAQLEHADHAFGRMIDALEKSGALDNTIVVVLSDNGASAEGGINGSFNSMGFVNGYYPTVADNLQHYEAWGAAETEPHYSAAWALAGNTPFNYYKQTVHGGGVRVPLIVAWPSRITDKGSVRTQFQHVNDIMPTVLAEAGIRAPAVVDGVKQQRLDGVDMSNTFAEAKAPTRKTVQYFELFGSRGVWADGWKAVIMSTRKPWEIFEPRDLSDDHWELFHVDADYNERVNLAAENPAKLKALRALFEQEARRNNVYPLLPPFRAHQEEVAAATIEAHGGHFVYPGTGASRIAGQMAPPFLKRAHRITANLTVPPGGVEGMIATYGGSSGGFALYLDNSRPVYVYRSVKGNFVTLRGPRLKSGPHTVGLSYERKGKDAARAILSVDGAAVAEGDITEPVPYMVALTDTFDIGRDTGTAVSADYALPYLFTGTLEQVAVDVAKE